MHRLSPVLGDELLDIRATGLNPGQSAILRGEVTSDCGRFLYESKGLYTADGNGEILGKPDIDSPSLPRSIKQ